MYATLLGLDAASWSALVAVAALIVAALARLDARRSARAAEATAAEARRANDIADRALSLEQERAHREEAEYVDRVVPRWAASEPGEEGWFKSEGPRLTGSLRNVGLSTARVVLAVLDAGNDRVPLDIRGATTRTGTWDQVAMVAPGELLEVQCDAGRLWDLVLQAGSRPSIYLDYEPVGVNRPMLGVTIELLRQPADSLGRIGWKVGAIRSDLRP